MPISLIGTQANILVVNQDVPAHSMAELIALAKAKPGQVQLRLVGLRRRGASRRRIVQDQGQDRYRACGLQRRGAGAAGRHGRPCADDVCHRRLRDRPDQERPVRALAVTTPKRTALLPDLPTVDELGIKGFDATTWHGLVAPAGTPKDIIDTLNFATVEALKDPPRRSRWSTSASISSATRRRNSRPTSRPKSRNGPRW